MSGSSSSSDLRELARLLHVHYDVRPEIVLEDGQRRMVGYEVRLWAVHSKGARALPGCPKCIDLVAELRRLANWALSWEERPTRADVEPFGRMLYDSRIVPGASEVALSIRLVHRNGWDAPVDACEERCLRQLRARMRELGVREG